MTVGGTPVSLGSRKQRAVLAMLVINRNRVVGSEALIDAVWGQRARQEARASLHTYVSNLRRLLNDAGVDGRTVLAAAPPGYRLSVPDIDCDIGRFVSERTAGIRAAAAGQFELASRHLSAAVAEWRGRVLEDLADFEFVASFAAALVEDEVNVHTAHAEAEIACGRGRCRDQRARGPYRRASLSRAAVGPTDHRLLHRRTAIRCPRRLPPFEDRALRGPGYRAGADDPSSARADPAPRGVGREASRTHRRRGAPSVGGPRRPAGPPWRAFAHCRDRSIP